MPAKAKPQRLVKGDAADFLEALLFVADGHNEETAHVKNWTIHEFHPKFVDAVEAFLQGFRSSLANSHPDLDPADCERSFGGNVFFSLSGHGCGFWDERFEDDTADQLQTALEAFSGDKYRFEQLDCQLAKFNGRIHLAYRTAAHRAEYLEKTFGNTHPAPEAQDV